MTTRTSTIGIGQDYDYQNVPTWEAATDADLEGRIEIAEANSPRWRSIAGDLWRLISGVKRK